MQVANEAASEKPQKPEGDAEKLSKKFEKGIDKGRWMWYNSKAVRAKAGRRSLKIEQQKRSTKQKQKCEIHSRQRVNIYSTK